MKTKEKQLNPLEISLLCDELGMFFSGGVPLYDAFLIMEENASSSLGRTIYHTISKELERGNSLADSLTAAACFPGYMLRMIRIGEDSGKLEEVFRSVSVYYQRREHTIKSIKSAVLYPLAMILVMMAILAVLMIKVLPIFSQVFEQVGARMPAALQVMVNSGSSMTVFCIIVLMVLACLALGYFFARRTERGRQLLTRIYEGFPVIRKIAEKSESNKFTYSLSLLLGSGVNLDEAINMILELTLSPKARLKLETLKTAMDGGEPFAQALSASGLLTSEYCAMIAVGLKTGRSDEMLDLAAQRLSDETDRYTERIISGIEPAIVIAMCLIIGSVLLSVMLPLMRIMTSM